MKAFITAAALLAALAPGVATAADLSGTWVRDAARSKVAPYPVYWITRAPPSGGNNNAFAMVVKQTPESVQVTDPVHPQRTYMLDGRARPSRSDSGTADMTTTATMKDDRLSVVTVQPYGGRPGNVEMTERQTWTVSPDGRTLTVDTVRETPALRQSYVEVFTRR